MTTQLLIFGLALTAAIVLFIKSLEKNNKMSEPTNEPIPTTPESVSNEPIDEPVKPQPVNCKYAQFKPAPEEFFYVDCCGKPMKGEGFQPWEKRTPVAIDVNKPFNGMEVSEDEAFVDC